VLVKRGMLMHGWSPELQMILDKWPKHYSDLTPDQWPKELLPKALTKRILSKNNRLTLREVLNWIQGNVYETRYSRKFLDSIDGAPFACLRLDGAGLNKEVGYGVAVWYHCEKSSDIVRRLNLDREIRLTVNGATQSRLHMGVISLGERTAKLHVD